MAQYNTWMNTRLYELCGAFSDEVRKRDQRAFFGSIHGTLNHLLAVDQMLLSHFTHGTGTFLPEGDLYDDFARMRQHRMELDAAILAWSGTLPRAWLEETVTFEHHADRAVRTVPRGFWVVQMFNHQTHHRGQITTLLTQLGADIGSTDLHMSVPRAAPP